MSADIIHLSDTGIELVKQVPENVRLDEGRKFLTLPPRYIHDRRLTVYDCQVLGAIAWYDRHGGNERGCLCGRKQISEDIGILEANVSRSLRRLQEFGYITVERDGTDGRRKVQRVRYTELKLITDGTKDRYPTGYVSNEVPNDNRYPNRQNRYPKEHKWVSGPVSNPLMDQGTSATNTTKTTPEVVLIDQEKRTSEIAARRELIREREHYLNGNRLTVLDQRDQAKLKEIAEDESMPDWLRKRARDMGIV
jgi:DNA-binding transcriptional ArsR family regulator